MTEQPSLVPHCSPPWHEEGARNALNRCPKHCLRQTTLVSIPRLTEIPPSGRNKGNTSGYIALTLGAWNVRTLTDNGGGAAAAAAVAAAAAAAADRPMRRTALVANELSRYNVHIAAMSETRLADEGQLKERGAGYTSLWNGRNA